MSGISPINHLLKGAEAQFPHDVEYIWQDDAGCAFQPPTLFEVAFAGDPIAEGLNEHELKDLNVANLQAGQKICSSCPVWHECYASADPMDFRFTMRAGMIPSRFKLGTRGRTTNPPIPVDPARAEDKSPLCPQGHDDWTFDVRGWRRCAECSRLASRAAAERAREKREAEGRGRKPAVGIARGKNCKHGHDLWKERTRKPGSFDCLPCKRKANRDRKRDQRGTVV